MANEETQILDYHERNNRFWGHPEYMEDYWLLNGYEWRDWLLQPKIDPRSLNDGGIPTNDYNMPAQPGLNMMPLNARLQVGSKYLDYYAVHGLLKATYQPVQKIGIQKVPLMTPKEWKDINIDFIVSQGDGNPWIQFLSQPWMKKELLFSTDKTGKINREVKDGHLVVPQSWNYIITFAAEVHYWENHIIATDMGKCKLRLYWLDKQKSPMGLSQISSYTIFHPDNFSGMTIQSLERGRELALYYGYKPPREEEILIWTTLTAVKIS